MRMNNSGSPEEFEYAQKLFEALKDFKDSAHKAEECRNKANKKREEEKNKFIQTKIDKVQPQKQNKAGAYIIGIIVAFIIILFMLGYI